MKRILIALMSFVAVLTLSCKNNENQTDVQTKDSTSVETSAAQPEVKFIDTLALFDYINGRFMDMSGDQFWSKDIFTPDYYDACNKLCEFSDGDALWCLGSIQELQSLSLTDLSEFKIDDYAHITAQAALNCKDIDGSGMEGTEFRTLKLILRDGQWLIDDVNNSKESYLDALREQEKNAQ